MTHPLPVGGVPRVHRARSLVLPRIAHFATPRSVLRLATVVAGAYALRRPPNAWLPGVPALPGPCYWLVPSETPMGWHRGCLATGLVRGTVCHNCLGACSALLMCARRSRQFSGGGALPVLLPLPLCIPLFWRSPRRGCCGLSRPGVIFLRLLVRNSMRSVGSAGPVRLPFGSAPRARCVCVRLCTRGVCAPPPWPVWRAHHARHLRRAPVGPFHAVRAPSRFLLASRAPPG